MSRRGRPAAGPRLVEHLDGQPLSKKRLQVILETLQGSRTVAEACQELGVGESQFHRLRERALEAALAELDPKPRGRRAAQPAVSSREEELAAEVLDLKMEVRALQLREEIALVMPHLLKARVEKKVR